MDDLFSDFDQMVNSFLTPTYASSTDFTPACDISESKEHYLVSFDMPGVKKEDIKIEVHENKLVISGERNQSHKMDNENFVHHERRYGQFNRSFSLPETINASHIEAHYEDGVLHVALPKVEEVKGRTIEIQSGSNKGLFSKLMKKKADKKTEIRDVKQAS
jgi:HSP20 family protein